MRRLLDFDRETGVATYHTYDHHEKTSTIETVQDVAPILEHNRKRMSHDTGGALGLSSRSKKQIKAGWWHVASIPIGVQYKWLNDFGVDIHNKDHAPAVKKLLNDPDWSYLRTNPGRL